MWNFLKKNIHNLHPMKLYSVVMYWSVSSLILYEWPYQCFYIGLKWKIWLSHWSCVGFLAMGEDWRMYCMALETYLQQVAAHTTLSKNKCLENFLTSSEVCYYHKTLFSFSSCLILPFSQCPILSCSVWVQSSPCVWPVSLPIMNDLFCFQLASSSCLSCTL